MTVQRTTQPLTDRWSGAIMGTYAAPELALVRGDGARVWDDTGREYLDLVAGIAVNALGHGHPALVEAVSRQVATLGHVANLYASPPAVALAERLLDLLGGRDGRVFFANSGAEANEAAFKLVRRTGRTRVVTALGSFHGRTAGALALTGQPAKREGFGPLVPGVVHVPYGDAPALGEAVGADTAAVFLEPVLGEGGVLPAPAGYLEAAREMTRDHGALLVLDEVQTGVARTGEWFSHTGTGVEPDVVTLAKGLGGGLPIGACVAFGPAAGLLAPGTHASTFGGNPVACAAALAVLDTIEAEGLRANAAAVGERITAGVLALRHPLVAGVRGAGLLLGITLTEPVARQAQQALQDAGVLVNAVAPDVIRLAPPLVLTAGQADAFVSALAPALDAAAAQVPV
jgi:acetylornithine/N-succinyldiaminopimelate aminotransferase